jgi:TetR/AcrR family transcriptional repressor of nem operon
MPRTAKPATSERILDIAEHLVQTRGFNAFSYADIAAALGITKASLHYHFASKGELGRRLIERYRDRFLKTLAAIDSEETDAIAKLRRYTEIYAGVLRDKRMCLCGMLAGDYATLPKAMKDGVKLFFDVNERWLAEVLEQGRKAGRLRFSGPAHERARILLAALEGSMMLARSYGETARFKAASDRLVEELAAIRARSG